MTASNLTVHNQERSGEKTDWFEVLPAELLSAATRTSELQRCDRSLGVMIEIVTANEAGAASFTPKILVPNAVAGAADLVIVTFTAITANGTNILVVYPGATDLGTEDKVATLPREWKLELTYAGTPASDKIDTHVYARYI